MHSTDAEITELALNMLGLVPAAVWFVLALPLREGEEGSIKLIMS